MNFFRALFYPFRDPHWFGKLLTTLLIAAIPVVGFFVIKGWEYEISARVRKGDTTVPDWKRFGSKFKHGLIIRMGAIFYNLPVYILIMLIVVMWARLIADYFAMPNPTWAALKAQIASGIPAFIAMIVGILFYALMANILYWSGYLQYIETGKVISFFEFVDNFLRAFENVWDDVVMGIMIGFLEFVFFLLDAVMSGGLVFTGVGAVIAAIFVPAFTFTVLSWFKGYLYGQLAINTLGHHGYGQ
jgi:hypothetical protein